MTIILKDNSEVSNVSFQEVKSGKVINATLSFSGNTCAEALGEIFTEDNVSQMVLKTEVFEKELKDYVVGNITVNYTDNTNYARIIFTKNTV